ncbi:hypothetical protein HKCCE4037_06830 [Rhodobacterales bacterium HKCCE4037]|nr:hypothetical protein [Rhodobacterales bacterium HKCCE4037]
MTRLAALLILIATPAPAWEAGVDGALCTLSHAEGEVEVYLTYDPSGPLYTITMRGTAPWPDAPEFGIRFDGARPNTILTDRHELSGDGRSLGVSDRGFGNVLDGLQFNEVATGFSGAAMVSVSLEGAAPEVEAFRACGSVPAV